MTATSATRSQHNEPRVQVEFNAHDFPEMTFGQLNSYFVGLQNLLALSLFAGQTEYLPGEYNRRILEWESEHIGGSLYLHEIRYGSPLNLVLGWSTTSLSCFAAMRASFYLWSQMLDLRVKGKQTSVQVAALEILQQSLPKPPEPVRPGDEWTNIDEEHFIRQRVRDAAHVLAIVNNFDLGKLPDPQEPVKAPLRPRSQGDDSREGPQQSVA